MIHTLCKENNINKVKTLKIIVNQNSHITDNNLSEHLMIYNNPFFDKDSKIDIIIGDIDEQNAVIETIEGEQVEQ